MDIDFIRQIITCEMSKVQHIYMYESQYLIQH